MNPVVPTISSGTAGPLGVLHMPRFWQKVSLDVVGKLHPEYPACGGGYDQMMLDALGLEKDEVLAFFEDKQPTYIEFERWVSEKATNLNLGTPEFNEAVLGYEHDEAVRREILESVGLSDDGSLRDAVSLNDLDDWQIFYQEEVG